MFNNLPKALAGDVQDSSFLILPTCIPIDCISCLLSLWSS